jgi:hypothetical protein
VSAVAVLSNYRKAPPDSVLSHDEHFPRLCTRPKTANGFVVQHGSSQIAWNRAVTRNRAEQRF